MDQQQPAGAPAAAAQPGAPAQLDQSALQRVVMAGQRLMYDQKTSQYFTNALGMKGNPVEILPTQVVGLLKLLDDKAQGKLPRQVLPAAAVALLVEAAHFAAEAGIFVMEKQDLAIAGKAAIELTLKTFGAQQAPAGSAPAQPAAAPAAPAPAAAPPAGIINRAQQGGA